MSALKSPPESEEAAVRAYLKSEVEALTRRVDDRLAEYRADVEAKFRPPETTADLMARATVAATADFVAPYSVARMKLSFNGWHAPLADNVALDGGKVYRAIVFILPMEGGLS